MALGFFRRRQKLVILVMVLLMVAFLIPTGIRGCFEPDRLKVAVGSVGKRKITVRMMRAAERDVRLLRDWLGLGRFSPPRPGEAGFVTFLERGHEHFLSWTLLLHEAGEMGIRVTERQVEEFLIRSGLDPAGGEYQEMLASLADRRMTEENLRQAVANYLLVIEALQTAMVGNRASLPELRHVFRELNERISLAMVTFPAEDFVKDVKDPADQEVRETFQKYRHLVAHHPENRTRFGFGYRVPDRLDVAYLFIDSERVERAVEPTEDEMLEYWQRYKGRMTRKEPVPTTATAPAPATTAPATTKATTAPATAPSTQATQPAQPAEPEFRDVVIERYSEAKPQIRRNLKERASEDKISELLRRADELIARFGPDEGAYAKTAAAMIRPADALLARKVARLPLRAALLSDLLEHLEEVTGVRIVYPLGQHGEWFLDGNITVEIDPKWSGLGLGELLAKIGAAHDYPKLQWVTCAGFESVIFPSAPVDLVPISSGRSGWAGPEDIDQHQLLGSAGMSKDPQAGGQTLASIVASVAEFQGPRPPRTPLVKLGDDFRPALYVSGSRQGRLLWRLLKAEAAHTPPLLTFEIRNQVVDDVKTVKAFKMAVDAAEAMKKTLDAGGELAELAEDQKREVVDAGPLARKGNYFGLIDWSIVAGVGQSRQFIEAAFKLVPEDPEPPHAGSPSAVIPLQRRRKVVLAQRTGYEPALASEFDLSAVGLGRVLLIQRQRIEVFTWFTGPVIARRVGFVEPMPE